MWSAKEAQMIKQAAYETDLQEENERLRFEIAKETSLKAEQVEQIKDLQREIFGVSASVQGEDGDHGFHSKFSDEFKIHSILGEGGFGCVFAAENKFDGAKYAVKRIAVDSCKTTVTKALGEVRAMAQFDHPGIVRYNSTWIERPPQGWQYEADLAMLKKVGSNNRLRMNYEDHCVFIYIQMQICKYSLTQWLGENNAVDSRPIPRMKAWFKQMVSAVAYIHDKNLIHRDLKSSNILFVESDRLKLCDLGIATQRATEDGATTAVTRTKIGTTLYMSPEQRFGSGISTAKYSSMADIFALGLILAELCVVMAAEERTKIFNNYRQGKQSALVSDKKTAEFISKITQVEPKNRLTCKDMLDHLFLA